MEETTNNPAVQEQHEMTQAELSELLQIRRDKLAALQQAGCDPYEIVKYDQELYSAEITENYERYEGQRVSVAGRMMSKRVMGKASFAHLLDYKGDIQIYVKRDDVGEEAYAAFKTMDIGDILGVTGLVFKTKTGEISVHCDSVTLLSKSLRPLPEKFHGLKDPELRY
ncbi:MAG: OB-fold nucleic acid binding domain-containing protein, partial [Eubacteriales bacterium]|nr:OB-fold nucleic acid binding domain-containing protein [Eubacteriales bacterium]